MFGIELVPYEDTWLHHEKGGDPYTSILFKSVLWYFAKSILPSEGGTALCLR